MVIRPTIAMRRLGLLGLLLVAAIFDPGKHACAQQLRLDTNFLPDRPRDTESRLKVE